MVISVSTCSFSTCNNSSTTDYLGQVRFSPYTHFPLHEVRFAPFSTQEHSAPSTFVTVDLESTSVTPISDYFKGSGAKERFLSSVPEDRWKVNLNLYSVTLSTTDKILNSFFHHQPYRDVSPCSQVCFCCENPYIFKGFL